MLEIVHEKKFDKDLKKIVKRGKDLKKLWDIIALLVKNKPLEKKNRNHKLGGFSDETWECHIEPDWLLIYEKTETLLILSRTGTHSDLFK
jgi:mRNA interferase YafQ